MRRRRKDYKASMLKQKLAGLAFALLGIISIPVCDMDATAALLFVPMGIYLLISSEVYIDV